MNDSSTVDAQVKKVNFGGITETHDVLATEEPLEIRLIFGPADKRIKKSLSVTMRTPGADAELATGFLYTEGIIKDFEDIQSIRSTVENVIAVEINEHIRLDLSKLERNFYTTSSCGVCGKSSIDAVRTVCVNRSSGENISFPASLIYQLPNLLREQQSIFESTGGLHASALFDVQGNLLLLREDVGRHNALDKLIGSTLAKGMVPLDSYLLLLSGRASFELIQKAAMAGIKIVAAVGAPSSLAVQMAEESSITLIGFLRDQRFNIYTGDKRIIF